jgi:NAD kinase
MGVRYSGINNNTISLPLVNLKCGNLYCIFPDVIQSVGKDSTVQSVATIFTPSADTIMQLEKGAQFAFLLPIRSPFKDEERLKNYFSVMVDSAGVKKEMRVCYVAQIEKK